MGAAAWEAEVREALCELLGISPQDIFWKRREQKKGRLQYEKLDATRRERAIPEGENRLLVNLADYLDTGLFLDHRDTRRLVGELAAERRVLNLFGYTGSFTVYAARGGARASTTVDLSNTYLDWARRNLDLNAPIPSAIVWSAPTCCASWARPAPIRGRATTSSSWTPPTFSNSKGMHGTLDVARDHPALVRAALALLAPGGTLLFSSNCRTLRLRPAEVRGRASTTSRSRPSPTTSTIGACTSAGG